MTREDKLAMLLCVPYIWTSGFVTARLWQWFVVPLGPPPISVATACGIICLVDIVRYSPKANLPEITCRTIEGLILGPWFFLLIGWIVRLFQ